jgi:hypothetical protein
MVNASAVGKETQNLGRISPEKRKHTRERQFY